MPQIQTKYFGIIEYQENSVFDFPNGLPGFEDERRFLFVEQPANKPLVFIQSLSQPSLCFVALPVQVVDPTYRLSLPSEDLSELGFSEDRQPRIGSEVSCLVIVALEEDAPPSVNLLSPLVVNLATRRTIQAIQTDSGYSHRHSLADRAEKAPCW